MMRRMLTGSIAAAIAFLPVAGACATGDAAALRAMLARSAAAWNRGDLDAFMRNYANSPATIYLSAKGVVRGYAAIRARYAAHYGRAMGVLGVSDLSVRPLGEDYAVAVARWHLARKNGSHPSGPFSLILHRVGGVWYIVEDCTP